jgi:hypothetical protein
MIATARDHKTSQQTSGVILKPGHWSSAPIHSFHHWTGETEVVTYCGLAANMADGARLTREIVNCVQCGQASLLAIRS